MDERMRVLEHVTAAFWAAAPSDLDLGTKGSSEEEEWDALNRWKTAKTAALQSMKAHQYVFEDIEEMEQRGRAAALLEGAALSVEDSDAAFQVQAIGKSPGTTSKRRPAPISE